MTAELRSQSQCPFCRSNNLFEGTILAESVHAYLTTNKYSPGNFLIIPKEHIESPLDLPDTWWRDVKELLAKLPELPATYNISLNLGKEAGQTIKHLHFWIIPRQGDTRSSGKGLAKLIAEADQA